MTPSRCAAGLLVAGLAAGSGCALFRPAPLDIPPGHGAAVGRVELTGFGTAQAALDIVRDDGTFDATLPASSGPREFALVLPQGRYRVMALRIQRDLEGDQASFALRVAFEVPADTAVYVGTLRISATFGPAVGVAVVDQYEDTLPALRRLYPDLPSAVVRRLMTPA